MSDWKIDLETCEASHACGLVLRFRLADDGLGGWQGELVSSVSISDVMRHFPGEQPAAVLPRLAREAGDAYSAAMARRN